jgi:hypothetical protein
MADGIMKSSPEQAAKSEGFEIDSEREIPEKAHRAQKVTGR